MNMKKLVFCACAVLGLVTGVWADGFSFTSVPETLSVAPSASVSTTFAFTSEPFDGTTVKVSGLPSGLKASVDLAARKVVVTGSVAKPQIAWMTLTGKNKAGWSHSAVVKVKVGAPAETDYDNIGLKDRIVPAGAKTGDEVASLLPFTHLDNSTVENLKSITFSGLPTGVSYRSDPLPALYGKLTKPGKFVIKMTVTLISGEKRTAQQTVVVKDAGCRLVKVAASTKYPAGTVSKAAVVPMGGKISVSAKPLKDHVFAGWYLDNACSKPLPQSVSGVDYRTPSFSYLLADSNSDGVITDLYARFVSKSSDTGLEILHGDGTDAPWKVNTGSMSILEALVYVVTGTWESHGIGVDSYSLPTLSFKGLPPGCTYDKGQNALVFKKKPEKPGTYTVVATAKNANGVTGQKTFQIIVPNLRSTLLDLADVADKDAFYDNPHQVTVGGFHGPPENLAFVEGSKVTVSGLPSGMKAKVDGNYVSFSGVPTKVGDYTVMFTIKNGTRTEKASYTIHVDPFPAKFVGDYYGVIKESDPGTIGSFKVSIASSGKASGKFTFGKKTYTFAETPCSQSETAVGYHNVGSLKEGFSAEFCIDGTTAYVRMSDDATFNTIQFFNLMDGKHETDDYDVFSMIVGSKNLAAEKGSPWADRAAALSKLGTLKAYASSDGKVRGIGVAGVPAGAVANVSAKVQANGLATVAGKIDGYSFSASTALQFDRATGKAFIEAWAMAGIANVRIKLFLSEGSDKTAGTAIGSGSWTIPKG